MARYEHLPIYQQPMDVAVHFEKVVAGFSRYHKYTLGTPGGTGYSPRPGRLFRGRPWAWASGLGENVSDGANAPSGVVVSHIIRANPEHDKPPMLLVLRGQLDELFILIRLAKEVQAFKSFAAYPEGSLGRMPA
jgi:hypothetical protein